MGTDSIAERQQFLALEPTVYTSQPARASLLLVPCSKAAPSLLT